MIPLPVVYPNDLSGCIRLYDNVVSYTELDWDGSNELMDLWELFGLRGDVQDKFSRANQWQAAVLMRWG